VTNRALLQFLLEEHGISQQEAARSLSVSPAYVNQMLTGTRPISAQRDQQLRQLAIQNS